MKKVLSLLLVVLMLLAMCACGEKNDATTATTTKPTTKPTTAPEPLTEAKALEIGKKLLGDYVWYGAVGACCDMEYVEADMSAYLSEAQKNLYIGSQQKITCCHTAAEVDAHIDRQIAKSLITGYPDDLLFSDDKGNLYIIIYPTGLPYYQDHRVVSFDENTIVLEADCYETGEMEGTAKVTCTKTATGFVLEKFEYTPANR